MSVDLPKLVLTPVGAAIADRLPADHKERWRRLVDTSERLALREGQSRDQTRLEAAILERLLQLDVESEQGLRDTSPEIKSLVKIGPDPRGKVVLYASDTGDGILCARILAEFIRRRWGCAAEMEVISGLQVEDAGRFRSVGAQNYVRSVVRQVSDPQNRYRYRIILNATAGFKALVPYTTLIGLLFQVPVQYIFERSSTLLTLPPLPVGFDEVFVQRVMPLLERLERETALPEEEVLKSLSAEERDQLLPLLEPEDGHYTLSSLGIIAYERYKSPPPLLRSSRRPEEKDHTRDYSQEPHRSAEFEKFKQRLAACPWVEGFHYHKGADPATKDVRQVGERMHITYGGIELAVETTATHPSHYAQIEEALRGLLQ
jgi:putative CRISPR-associated protein (TIGR02619 family)